MQWSATHVSLKRNSIPGRCRLPQSYHRLGAMEVLEDRRVLSQIVWDNILSGDNFSAYGANEGVARAIAIRAITDWTRVIDDFNYDGGGNTFHLELTAGGAAGCGGSTNITNIEVSSGKPMQAEIHMSINGCGNGWYFDPLIGTSTLPDDSDFSQLITPFAARRLGNDNLLDFYTIVSHEIGHALGINGQDPDLKIHDYLSDALMPDPVNPGGPGDPGDVLYALNIGGGPVEATFTSAGTGGSFAGHLYEGPSTLGTFFLGLPIHPNNLMNDGRASASDLQVRQLIPDIVAELLRDIYDYAIVLPSTINTFYANLNRSTDDLVVRGDPDDSDDVLAVNEIGSDVRVQVNGTSERIAASSVDLITIFGEDGDDYIHVDQTPVGIPTNVNGGLGDDVMTVANASGNLTFIDGDVSINGGPGTDVLNIQDLGHSSHQSYYITPSQITPSGLGYSIGYVNAETVFLQGDQGDSIFNIDGVGFQTTMHIYGQDGDDTFHVGGVSLFPSLDGMTSATLLTTNGGDGQDVVSFNDSAHVGSESYTLSNVSLTRTGISAPMAYSNMESVSLQAGGGNDTIEVVRISVPTVIDGGGGSDTFSVGDGDIDSNITSDLSLLAGTTLGPNDHLILDDELDSNNDSYFLTATTFQKFNFVGSLSYNSTFERVTLNANPHNNSIFVDEVGANTHLTVNGLGGDDNIYVGNGDIDSNILGDVSVHGGFGDDDLVLQDSLDQVGADSYTLTESTFDKTSYAGVLDFTFVNRLTLDANAFNNTIDINGTSVDAEVIVHGNDGVDVFNVNAPPMNQVTVHGGNPNASPGDLLTVTGTPVSIGEYRPSPHTPGNGVVTVDGVDIVFTGLEPIVASRFDTFVIVMPNPSDDLEIHENGAGQNVIRGTSGGVPFEELRFFDIRQFVVDLALNDNVASVDTLLLQAGDMPATNVDLLVVNAGMGANELVANSGITNLNTSLGPMLGRNLNITVDGSATRVNFLQSQDLRSLTVADGLVSLEPNSAQTVLLTRALAIAGGAAPLGTLDLHDNGLIVDYADVAVSPYAELRRQIIHARNQNAPMLWTGTGITSSVAAVDSVHAAVGYAEADQLFGGGGGFFLGQAMGAGNKAVLIRATRNGDANLDGVTDGSDFNLWNANRFGPGDWLQGDFNYDAIVDGQDFNAWNANKFQAFELLRGRPSFGKVAD